MFSIIFYIIYVKNQLKLIFAEMFIISSICKSKQINMNKEFLLNNTFNYINTQDDIVDVKITSIEHHYDDYYFAYYYFIENGKEKINDVHDGAIYVKDGFAYLYRSIEEAKCFEISTAMIKIKI